MVGSWGTIIDVIRRVGCCGDRIVPVHAAVARTIVPQIQRIKLLQFRAIGLEGGQGGEVGGEIFGAGNVRRVVR